LFIGFEADKAPATTHRPLMSGWYFYRRWCKNDDPVVWTKRLHGLSVEMWLVISIIQGI